MSDTGTQTGAEGTEPSGKDLRTEFETKLGEKDGMIAAKDVEIAVLRHVPGIDTAKPNVQAFIGGYKGELTKEAIEKAAAEWDIKPAATTTTEGDQTGEGGNAPGEKAPEGKKAAEPPTPEQRAAAAAAARAAGGAAPTGTDGDHPVERALGAFDKAVKEGLDPDHAGERYFETIIDAAAKNDQRVLIPQGRVGPNARQGDED